MVINDVVWQKSKLSMLRGILAIDGGSLTFTKVDDPETYTSGYTSGNTTYVKKSEYNERKLNKFLGGLVKKAAGVKESFTVVKADVQNVKAVVTPVPKYDPKTYKVIEGVFSYTSTVDFTVSGEAYQLSKNCATEAEANEFEGNFK